MKNEARVVIMETCIMAMWDVWYSKAVAIAKY